MPSNSWNNWSQSKQTFTNLDWDEISHQCWLTASNPGFHPAIRCFPQIQGRTLPRSMLCFVCRGTGLFLPTNWTSQRHLFPWNPKLLQTISLSFKTTEPIHPDRIVRTTNTSSAPMSWPLITKSSHSQPCVAMRHWDSLVFRGFP